MLSQDATGVRLPAPKKPQVRVRLVALPTEHGGWGMVGAPILLGLMVAPSVAGAWLALMVLGLFLTRQPLRLAISDLRRGKRFPRTDWAVGFSLAYGSVACFSLFAASFTADHSFWLPLAVFAALGAVQFWHDLRGQSRGFLPEASGAVAMAATAAAIAVAGGASTWTAFLLSAVLSLQSLGAILYVGARLRLSRGESIRRWPSAAVHVGAVVLFMALGHWSVAGAFCVLLIRALWGLSELRRPVKPAWVGVQEISYTILVIAAAVSAL